MSEKNLLVSRDEKSKSNSPLEMAPPKNKKIKVRVNRIAGQVAGISRMVDEDRYCVEILNQIAAVRSALDALGIELLTSHLETCVVGQGTESQHACAKPMSQDELLNEVRTTLSRFLR